MFEGRPSPPSPGRTNRLGRARRGVDAIHHSMSAAAHRRRVRGYVDSLAAFLRPGLFNPWGQFCAEYDFAPDAPAKRRARLEAHLSLEDPVLCLVGEAPGYQGCRYAGIPFCSERMLTERGIPRVAVLRSRITNRSRSFVEPSATIVWKALYDFGVADRVILANALALHPYKSGALTNRTPTPAELESGLPFLEQLRGIFPKTQFLPVGKSAARSFEQLGWSYPRTLRHPANGGAPEFRRGLRDVLHDAGALNESPRFV